MEIGDSLKLQEIEEAFSRFKTCPKCNSKHFWLGVKSSCAYVHCKGCGSKFELHEVYVMNGESKTRRFKFLKNRFLYSNSETE
jgi:transcription elongation factor Elf1